ncbi:TonB-dependent receptor [Cellvibrio sp. KY-GH-1]|uniref:TonB-dependent receptor domain-containing protein n=1 Tax=Cellvibrio sp. KY-GH-1 TaxID=2303332 RepID=UPI00124748BE|nr:TonB-dependent receptor [Cellvibrio sp. KY-GH-1]QEY18563.1 TonB-dependent receptor [Cellvibrio sp. KY-GH-1]
MQRLNTKRRQLFLAITAASLGICNIATAQEAETQEAPDSGLAIEAPVIEEMLVTGRQQSAAQSVVTERLEEAFAADLMSSDQISRTGDSNVAVALTRVTGVTLLDGKYVYVRSLGERYSSTTLNGAAVPSPELTRNVLPLDLIPSSIVESLKVQKAYSPELAANFGGGAVDIRTKGVPDEFVFSIAMGSGMNSESDDGLTHASHGEKHNMPAQMREALNTYQGNLSEQRIGDFYKRANPTVTNAERDAFATQTNRDLLLSLNRDVEIYKKSLPVDFSGSLALGNSWDLNDDISLGAVVNFGQDTKWRNKDQERRDIGSPEDRYSKTERTSEETRQVISTNLGLDYQDMHKLQASVYHIENIHDEARIKTGFNGSNYTLAEGSEYVFYDTRMENRELEVGQLTGEHKLDQLNNDWLDTLVFDWFYSDSTVKTDVPNHTTVAGDNTVDPTSGAFISTQLSPRAAMASFEFLNLEDSVISNGWNAKVPLMFDRLELTLSGGFNYNEKSREYYGYTANIDAGGNQSSVLSGNVNDVLNSNRTTDLNNNFDLSVGGGFGTESYVAGQIIEGAYGMFDANWDETWRITGGARKETFKQGLLPVDLLDYTGNSLVKIIDDIANNPDQRYGFAQEDWYPSLAITYMNEGFMNTEAFQVRLSASETVVRPDLREMSDVVYIDTELGMKVKGNSRLEFSELTHYDLRAEWFFDSGNNFTATLFYKDIANPIESTRLPGSDDDVILTFENSLSGEIYGLEMEILRDLGAGFFASSNLTLSESEIVSPEGQGYTNSTRPMTGQSEYVLNAQLGFDSEDGQHSASLVYNLFGERLFFAARNIGTHQDAYEQPFNSLDLTYSWYATDNVTTKIKLGNILNEERVFEQVNSNGESVDILKQQVGTSFSLDVKYTY